MQQLLGGPRSSFTEAEVLATLAHVSGTKLRHGVDLFTVAGAPVDATVNFQTGDVHWAYRPDDDVTGVSNEITEIRTTADLTIVGPTELFLEALRYQMWTELRGPSGNWIRTNKVWGMATNPPIEDDGMVLRRTLKIVEATHRFRTDELAEPLTIDAGENCAGWVADDLASRYGITAVEFPASTVTLTDAKTFTAGTSVLAVYNAMFETAALDQMTINPDNGRPRTVALADLVSRGAEVTYGPGHSKIVTAATVEPLLASIPNALRVVARQGPSLPEVGNGIAERFNQSTGPASIDRRGEEIWRVVDVEAEDQAELEAIADDVAQRWFAGGGFRMQSHVALNPLHGDRDVARLVKPRLGFDGTWLVTAWSYPMHKVTGPGDVLMPMTFEQRVEI
jgi:hypothetical protein